MADLGGHLEVALVLLHHLAHVLRLLVPPRQRRDPLLAKLAADALERRAVGVGRLLLRGRLARLDLSHLRVARELLRGLLLLHLPPLRRVDAVPALSPLALERLVLMLVRLHAVRGLALQPHLLVEEDALLALVLAQLVLPLLLLSLRLVQQVLVDLRVAVDEDDCARRVRARHPPPHARMRRACPPAQREGHGAAVDARTRTRATVSALHAAHGAVSQAATARARAHDPGRARGCGWPTPWCSPPVGVSTCNYYYQ